MNTPVRLSLAALALFTLVACGDASAPDDDSARATAEEAADLGRDTDATVFDDMVQTQDKARAVEGVTLGHKQDLDQAIEESSTDSAEADDE